MESHYGISTSSQIEEWSDKYYISNLLILIMYNDKKCLGFAQCDSETIVTVLAMHNHIEEMPKISADG